jgi:hypothetical protein
MNYKNAFDGFELLYMRKALMEVYEIALHVWHSRLLGYEMMFMFEH